MGMMMPPGMAPGGAPPGGGGPPQVPPELLQQLLGAGGAAAGGAPQPPTDQSGYGQGDPLSVLQECIQALPGVIAALPDARDTQDATKALLILTQIQARMMPSQTPAGGPAGR